MSERPQILNLSLDDDGAFSSAEFIDNTHNIREHIYLHDFETNMTTYSKKVDNVETENKPMTLEKALEWVKRLSIAGETRDLCINDERFAKKDFDNKLNEVANLHGRASTLQV